MSETDAATELVAGAVWRLDLGSVNAYLVDDGDLTLVDAGTPGAAADLRAALTGLGYEVTELDRVLVTHYDFDHVGGLVPLGVEAPVYAMEPDAGHIEGVGSPPWTNKKGLLQRVTDRFLDHPAAVERVADGDVVGGFTAYHTPGHTPGHLAYYHAGLGVLFAGDLVAESDGRLSTPPWPLAYDNGEVRRSVRALAERGLDFEVVCMGHGDPLTVDARPELAALAARS